MIDQHELGKQRQSGEAAAGGVRKRTWRPDDQNSTGNLRQSASAPIGAGERTSLIGAERVAGTELEPPTSKNAYLG